MYRSPSHSLSLSIYTCIFSTLSHPVMLILLLLFYYIGAFYQEHKNTQTRERRLYRHYHMMGMLDTVDDATDLIVVVVYFASLSAYGEHLSKTGRLYLEPSCKCLIVGHFLFELYTMQQKFYSTIIITTYKNHFN